MYVNERMLLMFVKSREKGFKDLDFVGNEAGDRDRSNDQGNQEGRYDQQTSRNEHFW